MRYAVKESIYCSRRTKSNRETSAPGVGFLDMQHPSVYDVPGQYDLGMVCGKY